MVRSAPCSIPPQRDCLDLESRKGKAPGGYQYDRDRRRVPFIFMNAAGLQRDLETMVHEAGHAFHAMLSRDEPLVAYRTHFLPIEFAEVASMSMELFAHPFLDEFYDQDQANRARRRHLEDIVRTLSWIATIDAFQHWIYTHPDHTREQRDIYWLELDAMYGPNVDWSGFEDQRAAAAPPATCSTCRSTTSNTASPSSACCRCGCSIATIRRMIANYRKAMTLGGSRPLPELFEAAELTFDFDRRKWVDSSVKSAANWMRCRHDRSRPRHPEDFARNGQWCSTGSPAIGPTRRAIDRCSRTSSPVRSTTPCHHTACNRRRSRP